MAGVLRDFKGFLPGYEIRRILRDAVLRDFLKGFLSLDINFKGFLSLWS